MKHGRSGPGLAPLMVLLVCAVALAAASAVELGVDTDPRPVADVAAHPPASGWSYCPVTAGEDEEAVLAVAPATEQPSSVTVVRYTAGGRVVEDPVEVAPGEQHRLVLDGAAAREPVAVRWTGAPAVATWSAGGEDTAAAPCETGPARRWHVTGFDTTAQNRGLLHLFNPFGVDAVVRVTFGTPSGRVALVLTDNVHVGAGSALTMTLNDYEPEQPDLAVTVETLSGRVVAGGETRLRPTANQPGPTGRALLRASPEPAGEWSLAAAASRDEGEASWVSVYNPADREAAVQVRVSDPLPEGAALLSEVSVPAGGVIRLQLEETSATPEHGVLVQAVTDLPVVVSGLSVVRTEAGDGVAASLAGQAAERWALAGGASAGWSAQLALYNPGAEAVRVAVDVGEGTPASWAGIEIGPNGRAAVDLAEAGDRASLPLRVTGDGPFVAELRSRSAAEPVRLWTAVAVPSRVWEGPSRRPATWRDPRLSTSPVPGAGQDGGDPVP